SFAWGSGLSDEQTFSAQLSKMIHAGVLNASLNAPAVPQLPPSVASVVEVLEYGHIAPDFLRPTYANQQPITPEPNFFRAVPVERFYFPAIFRRTLKKLGNDMHVGPGEVAQPLANAYLRIGLTDSDADQLVQIFTERAAYFRRQ